MRTNRYGTLQRGADTRVCRLDARVEASSSAGTRAGKSPGSADTSVRATLRAKLRSSRSAADALVRPAVACFMLAAVAMAADPNSFKAMRPLFADPPAEYATAPFFVWNGDVTEAEIDRVIADYLAQGVKSFIIHPRPGLITEYLSPRWFALVRYTVEKAQRAGMKVWLYDENSYPSGFAGGHVPADMPESYNQGQGLVMRKDTGDGKCAFVADGNCFELAYYRQAGNFGGFTYVDLIKPGVTEKFIDLTMRGYEREIGKQFGNTVPGIFTDEPNINPPNRKNGMRWTPDLFDQFQKRWGYDLKTNLVSLFEEKGDWRRVRHNYYSLLLDLFIERWSKPWSSYAEKAGLAWTGHYWEHAWPDPGEGPDNMAMYAWPQVPAIDMLFNQFREDVNAQFGNVRSVKELASVANQMGRRRKLSETYGGGGWDLRLEDMKRLGDWEYALGVNLMNQHLSYQSMLGARKYDYPQSFSYHAPWWRDYHVSATYFARLSLALSTGEQVNRILILEPTTSAWMYASCGTPDPKLKQLGAEFQAFITQLESRQVEYDLGSERVIRDYGKVENRSLAVGRRAYDMIVLPPGMENLDSSTLKLLQVYRSMGGAILAYGDPPSRIDGVASDAARELVYHAESINRLLPDAFVGFEGKIFHQRRELEDGELIFLVNSSLDQPARGALRLAAQSLTELDLSTGQMSPRNSNTFELPPAGSLLLFASPGPSPIRIKKGVIPAGDWRAMARTGALSVRRASPNALTLDYCDLKLAGAEQADIYVPKAGAAVFQKFGFERGDPWGGGAIQYKTTILDRNKFAADSGFEADFHFQIDGAMDWAKLRAAVERPGIFKAAINGTAVAPVPGQWWLDRGIAVYEIGPYVNGGENTITVSAHPMSVHAELAPIYLLGDFALEPREKGWRIITPAPLALGSWKDQGLPFYSDWMAYSATYRIDRVPAAAKVRLGKWTGTVAEVAVNGKPAGAIAWQPYEADITRFLRKGENKIEVRVCGSPKNLIGPHHNNPPKGIAAPAHFAVGPQHTPPGKSYDLFDYGLLTDFELWQR